MKVINEHVYTFSRDNKPLAYAEPGEVMLFETLDCFAQQINSETQLVHELDLNKANPASGPVYINGAEPGDVLAVDIFRYKCQGKGICLFY